MSNWTSLREAAKLTRLSRGWIYLMCQAGKLRTRPNIVGLDEVYLPDVEGHKIYVNSLETLRDKLLVLLNGNWTKHVELNRALPGTSGQKLQSALDELIECDLIEKREYHNRGRVGRKYRRVTNDIEQE